MHNIKFGVHKITRENECVCILFGFYKKKKNKQKSISATNGNVIAEKVMFLFLFFLYLFKILSVATIPRRPESRSFIYCEPARSQSRKKKKQLGNGCLD